MEFELHNLRKLLNAEMRLQESSDCVNDKFNEKIEDIENQIEQLDAKLTETTEKLKQSKQQNEELTNRVINLNFLFSSSSLFLVLNTDRSKCRSLSKFSACNFVFARHLNSGF